MPNQLAKKLFVSFLKYIIVIFGPSVSVVLLYSLLDTDALNDGQFILGFILSIPAGIVFGIGLFFSDYFRKQKRDITAILVHVLTGLSVLVFCFYEAFSSASSRVISLSEFVSTAVSPWCFAPIAFGTVFMFYGLAMFVNLYNHDRGTTTF